MGGEEGGGGDGEAAAGGDPEGMISMNYDDFHTCFEQMTLSDMVRRRRRLIAVGKQFLAARVSRSRRRDRL